MPGSRSITSRREKLSPTRRHAALGVVAFAVERDDAGRFLAAVLEGVQAERGDGGGVGVAEDAEHPAFLAEAVCIRVEDGVCGSDPSFRPLAAASLFRDVDQLKLSELHEHNCYRPVQMGAPIGRTIGRFLLLSPLRRLNH